MEHIGHCLQRCSWNYGNWKIPKLRLPNRGYYWVFTYCNGWKETQRDQLSSCWKNEVLLCYIRWTLTMWSVILNWYLKLTHRDIMNYRLNRPRVKLSWQKLVLIVQKKSNLWFTKKLFFVIYEFFSPANYNPLNFMSDNFFFRLWSDSASLWRNNLYAVL